MYARVRVFGHLETAKGNRKGDGLLRESYVERKLTTEANFTFAVGMANAAELDVLLHVQHRADKLFHLALRRPQ